LFARQISRGWGAFFLLKATHNRGAKRRQTSPLPIGKSGCLL
jgi:hypothetical protein